MIHHVYFLLSLKDGNYYIGCTSRQTHERLREHNNGQVTSTKHRRPLKLVYFETFGNRQEAFKREWYLKHPAGYQDKLRIIQSVSQNLGL
jgi:putative endonuclease